MNERDKTAHMSNREQRKNQRERNRLYIEGQRRFDRLIVKLFSYGWSRAEIVRNAEVSVERVDGVLRRQFLGKRVG